MSHTRSSPFFRTVVLALALALAACGTKKPAPAPSADQLAAMATRLTAQEQRLADLAGDKSDTSPVVTRVVFNRGNYKPGIERLRVVRRQNTINGVAAQVVLNVALIALAGGGGVQGFSKNDLAGDEIPELANDAVAENPALKDLPDGLGRVATRLYARRAIDAVAEAKTDGSTPQEIADASQMPKVVDTPLLPAGWQFVYDTLVSGEELFRLKFGAQMGRPGFRRPPMGCIYESEPLSWAAWGANGWQRLRSERAQAVTRCTAELGSYAETRW